MNLNLDLIQTALLQLYIIISMVTMGFRLTWTQLQGASQHRSLIGRALLANIVLVPLAAVLLVRLLDMPLALATGLFLAAAAPGAPFAPKLAERAKGPYPIAVGLMFVLTMVSVVTTPATVAYGLPAEGEVQIHFWPIFIMLVLVQSLPLLVGVTVNSRWPDSAQRWTKPLTFVGYGILVIVLVVIGAGDTTGVLAVNWYWIAAAVLLTAGTLVLGWLLGGPELRTRRMLAITTSARNVPVALLIAETTFHETSAAMGVIVFALTMVIADIALAAYWTRQRKAKEEKAGVDGKDRDVDEDVDGVVGDEPTAQGESEPKTDLIQGE
jgi:BASS family bile acid:Na+ symporter